MLRKIHSRRGERLALGHCRRFGLPSQPLEYAMNPRRLFVASCISLVTSAFTFVVRGDILQDMGNAFDLSQTYKGLLEGAVFYGMAFSMLIGGPLCDVLGMKRIMNVAFLCHFVGVLGTIFAPHSEFSFHW